MFTFNMRIIFLELEVTNTMVKEKGVGVVFSRRYLVQSRLCCSVPIVCHRLYGRYCG